MTGDQRAEVVQGDRRTGASAIVKAWTSSAAESETGMESGQPPLHASVSDAEATHGIRNRCAHACYGEPMSRRAVWERLYERFDVDEHVTDPCWRADRAVSPAAKIVEILASPFASDARILVTGTAGTGKTTELLRVAAARASHELVVFLDVARHFERLGRTAGLQHVSSWEVCFLVGLALCRAAEDRLGASFLEVSRKELESAWAGLARASGTPQPRQLDVARLGEAIVAAGVVIIGDPAGSAPGTVSRAAVEAARASWNLPMGTSSKRILDDDERAKAMLDAVNRLIGEIQVRHRPVLLVLDGLDRIQGLERVRELFVESEMLARLTCRTLASAPGALRQHSMALAVPRFQFQPLVNEPVRDLNDPVRPGPGLPFFTDLFLRRTHDLDGEALIAQPLLDRIACYSGGLARDFVTMIRLIATRAWQVDVPAATEEIVESVIDQERRLLETGVHRGHIAVLEAVMRDPDHRLPADDLVWELLTRAWLLPYPGRSIRFYPHPLLTRHLLSRAELSRAGESPTFATSPIPSAQPSGSSRSSS